MTMIHANKWEWSGGTPSAVQAVLSGPKLTQSVNGDGSVDVEISNVPAWWSGFSFTVTVPGKVKP